MDDEALYRQDLERLAAEGCQIPGCRHTLVHSMLMHARCHPAAGMRAEYQSGHLWLRCRQCRDLLAVVAVADAPAPGARHA